MTEKQKAQAPPTKSSATQTDEHFLGAMFRMVGGMKYAPTDADAIGGWKLGAERILGEIGRGRFAEGIAKWLATHSEFPWPKDIREQTPEPVAASSVLEDLRRLEEEFNAAARVEGMTPAEYRQSLAAQASKLQAELAELFRKKAMP